MSVTIIRLVPIKRQLKREKQSRATQARSAFGAAWVAVASFIAGSTALVALPVDSELTVLGVQTPASAVAEPAETETASIFTIAEIVPVGVGSQLTGGESVVAKSSDGDGDTSGESEVVSEAKQQFIADIGEYNSSRDPAVLQKIHDYLVSAGDDAERFNQLGRELVITDGTAALLLAVAEASLQEGDPETNNGLGFIVLRMDASDFWRTATLDEQVRFEGLIAAIRGLPQDNVHRFTRFMADRAHERMAIKEEPGPLPLLHYSTRRQRFEILGTDYNAIQSTGMLARSLESIVGDYLPYIDDFPQPIWVRIESGLERTPAFQIQVAENGNVGVVLFWSEQITIEDVSKALSWALLQRIAIWRWNMREQDAVPYWLWRGLAAEIPVPLQSARNQGLARDVSEIQTLMPLAELVGARAIERVGLEEPDSDAEALQALWLYRFLRDEAPSRPMFGMLVEAFLSGEEAMSVLQRAFPEQTANADVAQEWWEIGVTSLVHRQHGVIYSLAQSNALIESLSGVTAWWDGQDRRMRGPALLPLREDPRWQSAFWRQQRELKLELQRINPIYFNSLLSLGHFYELLLTRGGPAQQMSSAQLRTEAEAAYAQFLEDWAYAQALHQAVDQALEAEAN